MSKAREAAWDALMQPYGDFIPYDSPSQDNLNAAIDAFLGALKADGYVVHGPNARWIEIGDAGAVVQFREGSEVVIHNADYGMYYETLESQPVTVFRPRASAPEAGQ